MNNTDATNADAGRICCNRDRPFEGFIPIVQPGRGLVLDDAPLGERAAKDCSRDTAFESFTISGADCEYDLPEEDLGILGSRAAFTDYASNLEVEAVGVPRSLDPVLDLIPRAVRDRSGTVTKEESMVYNAWSRPRPLRMRLRC